MEADGDLGRSRLRSYWKEWTKERLAALAGPIDIYAGRYPRHRTYRSTLIVELRDNVAKGNVKSEGPIRSPKIEPVIKKRLERGVNNPEFANFHSRWLDCRRRAAQDQALAEDRDFSISTEAARFEALILRYQNSLTGFKLDSHGKTGLVFRRITSNRRVAFLLIEEARDSVGYCVPLFCTHSAKKQFYRLCAE